MSTIKIGNDQRELGEADPQWIAQEIHGRHRDGQAVCVTVRIDEPGATLSLCTPGCRLGGGGGGRAPNAREAAIFELWSKCGLNDGEVEPGEVIRFVRQVLRLF